MLYRVYDTEGAGDPQYVTLIRAGDEAEAREEVAKCYGQDSLALVAIPTTRAELVAPVLLTALHVVRCSRGWQYMADETRALIEDAVAKAKGA